MFIKIVYRKQSQTFVISANKEERRQILQTLAHKECFVTEGRHGAKNFLRIDHRALKILQEQGIIKNSLQGITEKQLSSGIEAETQLAKELQEKSYNFNQRIWCKKENGKTIYCSKIEGDIYSSENLDGLISFLKGEYLIEINKKLTSLSINPFTAFGVFGVIGDALNSNKSVVRHKGFSRKKEFQQLINEVNLLKIIIDGADDTAAAANSSDIPQQAAALMQGLFIFPVFLKGVHLGYEGLGGEAKENWENYKKVNAQINEILLLLEKFRNGIAQICEIDLGTLNDKTPAEFLRIINKKLIEINKSDETDKNDKNDKLNKIIALTNEYQLEITKEIESPSLNDVISAHVGWMAMTSMMTSIVVYEAQALINIFKPIETITTAASGQESLFSQIGNGFGFGGQCLMTAYALYSARDERKQWKEVQKELEEFRDAQDVSDLAKKITEKLLKGKRDNHRAQTFGNAILATGQAMMAFGGPVGFALNPLLFAGLGATLLGVGINSTSELKYQSSFEINEDLDDVEKTILTKAPNFSFDDFKNVSVALTKHANEQILALEILGHLRAPQWILYQKFIKENQNEKGILSKAAASLGGEKIRKWINNPPQDSIELIEKDDLEKIKVNSRNSNDLDLFNVTQDDFDKYFARYKTLKEDGKSHQDIIKILQHDFITEKSQNSELRPKKTAIEICKEILEKNGDSAVYLQKKLLRAVANGDLKYKGNLEEANFKIKKNGEEIAIAKLDINKFSNDEQLENFLNDRRKQKKNFSKEKTSILQKAYGEDLYSAKSNHLRPFSKIEDVVKARDTIPIINEVSTTQDLSLEAIKIRDSVILTEENLNIPLSPNKSTVALSPSSKFIVKECDLKTKLEKFKETAHQTVLDNERDVKIQKQNQIIDEVVARGKEFILISTQKIDVANQTIFTYADPNCSDPKHVDYKAKQITYIRDDLSGKINVIYGKDAYALIVERADEIKNGLITQLDKGKIEHYGDRKNTNFVSFKKDEVTPSPTMSPISLDSVLPLVDRNDSMMTAARGG